MPRPPPARRCVKVLVLTTSYPRWEDDVAGRFVADAVERVRARGVDVDVVAPERSFQAQRCVRRRHPREPARGAVARSPAGALPRRVCESRAPLVGDAFSTSSTPTGCRRGRRFATGRPFVLQLWDGRRAGPARARFRSVRRARGRLRLDRARGGGPLPRRAKFGVIPSGVDLPERVDGEAEPPHVLYAGRLSPEKGVRLRRRDPGPAARDRRRRAASRPRSRRARVSSARRFDREYAGRPSWRSHPAGRASALVCAEAMAHKGLVVASRVGGLVDLVVDGETGLLVPSATWRRCARRSSGCSATRSPRRLGTAAWRAPAIYCASTSPTRSSMRTVTPRAEGALLGLGGRARRGSTPAIRRRCGARARPRAARPHCRDRAVGLPRRRRARRGGRDRATGREPPRARLSAGEGRSPSRPTRPPTRPTTSSTRSPRASARPPAPPAARRQGRAERGRQAGERRDRRLLGCGTRPGPDALRRLVSPFADPEVAYACGQLRLERADGTNREGVYWRYELWLRESESRLGSVTGGNGSIYAVRREDYPEVDGRFGHDLASRVPARAARPPSGVRARRDGVRAGRRLTSRRSTGGKVRMFEHCWLITLRGRMLRGRRRCTSGRWPRIGCSATAAASCTSRRQPRRPRSHRAACTPSRSAASSPSWGSRPPGPASPGTTSSSRGRRSRRSPATPAAACRRRVGGREGTR